MSSSKSPSKKARGFSSFAERKARAQTVIDRLKTLLPDPKTELVYQTPYQLLVSVVLSAQCTDKQVNKVMVPLQEAGFCPEQALAWGADGLLARIRSIGFAPTKSRNVYALTKILTEKFGGNVPRRREDLESLPGVGRKTANVILAEIYKEPQMAVDTHVFRVSARLGLQKEKTPEKAELELLKVINPRELPAAHHLFILHGRYTCKALKPDCANCIVNDVCPSAFKVSLKPRARPRAK